MQEMQEMQVRSLAGRSPGDGRKVLTNVDSILKNRDITLPTKVHLVKATVFPLVMYGCEKRLQSSELDIDGQETRQ